MKAWYAMTDKELANFFDVDMSKGLSGQSVIARLDKFGLNNDPSLSHEMQEIYKAWVKRDGRIECIAIKYIVPGDIVLLDTGSRVPADLRLLHVHQLGIDQSLITGEALPATKSTDKMQKSYQKADSKTKKNPLNLTANRLKRLGIAINNKNAPKLLNDIDFVYIDYFLRSEDMLEVIRKVQLGLGINCVFMVSEDIALNLKKELPSAQIYCGKEIANHVPKQILSVMVDTQFISNANYIDILKVVSTLQQHGSKILWLSDGKNSSQVVGVATLSMIVGSIARDDNLNKADLIAVNSRPIVVASILHNKK